MNRLELIAGMALEQAQTELPEYSHRVRSAADRWGPAGNCLVGLFV